ncbi:MAG: TonB-dependent receptor [Opitutaceae bacterium]|nr:TonB-dependent receptor [Opitutaceae bacterium]
MRIASSLLLYRLVRSRAWAVAALLAGAGFGAEGAVDDAPVLLRPYVVEEQGLGPGVVCGGEPVERSAGGSLAPVMQCSLADLLGGSAGLVVQPGFGEIDPPRISARGSGLQSAPVNRGLLVRMNGLPLNAADGTFNTALIESAFFEGVQARPASGNSASSALALGGALDFLGYAPMRLAAAGGSDGLRKFVAQAGAAPFPVIERQRAYRVAGAFAAMQAEGWRLQSAQQRTAAIAQTAWGRGEEYGVRASLYGTEVSYDVPGPLTLGQAEANPDSLSAMAAADRPRRETQFGRLAVTGEWRRSELGLSGAFSVQQTDDWFRQLRSNGLVATRGTDCAAQLSGRMRMLSVGALWLGTWRDQQRFSNLAGVTGPRFADLQQEAHSVAGWADSTWRLGGDWEFTTGFSWLYADRVVDGSVAVHSDYSAILPRLGVEWRPTSQWKLFARAQRGTEAPTFDDLVTVRGASTKLALAWAPLRRQRADTGEVGLRYDGGSPISFGVTAYAANWRDELLRLADASGAARGTVNAGPTWHRGIESSLSWVVSKGRHRLACWIAHNWNVARFAGDPVYGQNRLAGLPEHAGAAELEWSHDHGTFAAFGANWVWGRTYADHANRLSYPGYALASLRLGWRKDRWSVALEVGNVLDRGYIASTAGVVDLAREPAGTAVFLPGRPRSLVVSVERRW